MASTEHSARMNCDVAVVGGGIVGLAIAAEILRRTPGRSIVVLEKESTLAAHQSGRNSGVIHSGLYYRPGSLKARLCVRGAEIMKRFCREHGVPILQCGKVIVATRESEIPRLEELSRRAAANGVVDVQAIGPDRLREIEPHATGLRALWVPGVGVTDYRAVTQALAQDVVRAGGQVVTSARVGAIRREDRLVLETSAGAVRARFLITSAGLHSDRIVRASSDKTSARIVPFRGEYAMLRPERESLVRGLIYPVPDPDLPFLGVHFTRRVHGGVDAGPNAVLALKREGYRWTDLSVRDLFDTIGFAGFWRMARRHATMGIHEVLRSFSRRRLARDLQRLVPDLREEDLVPGDSGVRAQAIDPDGTLVDDFRLIEGDRTLHVVNAPSPAATASLAIARHVVEFATFALQ